MRPPRLLVVLLLVPGLARAEIKPTCAVLTFGTGIGVAAEEATCLSDRYAALLAQLGTYDVLARSQMAEILKIQEVSVSNACSERECAVEMGTALQVEYVVFGTVGHVGSLYSLSTSLVEVESTQTVATAVTDHEGRGEDFMRWAAADNIRSLLAAKQTPADWGTLGAPEPSPPAAAAPAAEAARPAPSAVAPEPATVAVSRPKRTVFHFGPRLGVSTLTGVAGVELQIGRVAIDAGYALDQMGVGAVRYYFRPESGSWYVALNGAAGVRGHNRRQYLAGLVAGYRWFWKGHWSLALGLGAGAGLESDAEDEVSYPVQPLGELAGGFSF